jgi:hypothetical protein
MISGIKKTVEIIGEFDEQPVSYVVEYPSEFEEGFLGLKITYGDEGTKELVFTTEQAEEIAKGILTLIKRS